MPECDRIPPICNEHELLAHQRGCYVCVNPRTCLPWGEPGCRSDRECLPLDWCNSCGTSSCPLCRDCLPACTPHGCPSEEQPLCLHIRPECEENQVAVVRGGCWLCVDRESCEPPQAPTRCEAGGGVCLQENQACPAGFVGAGPQDCPGERAALCCQPAECREGAERPFRCPDGSAVPWCRCAEGRWICNDSPERACRDTRCDDGSALLCLMPGLPVCRRGEIPALLDGCWRCVDPATCRPWGEPGCRLDAGCPPAEQCHPCGTSSCPRCDDCLPACRMHGCPSEELLTCRCARPDCGDGAFSVIRNGCWICVTPNACQPTGRGCVNTEEALPPR